MDELCHEYSTRDMIPIPPVTDHDLAMGPPPIKVQLFALVNWKCRVDASKTSIFECPEKARTSKRVYEMPWNSWPMLCLNSYPSRSEIAPSQLGNTSWLQWIQ